MPQPTPPPSGSQPRSTPQPASGNPATQPRSAPQPPSGNSESQPRSTPQPASGNPASHAGSARPSPPQPTTPTPRPATLGQVIGAVFWSFFGVRKGKAMQRDAVTIKPLQVVIVGLVLAALFVLTLLLVVRLILSHAT